MWSSTTPTGLALTALFSGYLEQFPRYDPHPRSYADAAATLGWPRTTLVKRIEYLRSRLTGAGVPNLLGETALASLAEWALTSRVVTRDDLRLLRPVRPDRAYIVIEVPPGQRRWAVGEVVERVADLGVADVVSAGHRLRPARPTLPRPPVRWPGGRHQSRGAAPLERGPAEVPRGSGRAASSSGFALCGARPRRRRHSRRLPLAALSLARRRLSGGADPPCRRRRDRGGRAGGDRTGGPARGRCPARQSDPRQPPDRCVWRYRGRRHGARRSGSRPHRPRAGPAPPHVPPEVLEAGAWWVAGDLWALGSCLHTILTGQPPWAIQSEQGVARLLLAIANREPPGIWPPGTPGWLQELLVDCLAGDVTARPASAAEVGARLHDRRGSLHTLAPAPPVQGRPLGSRYLLLEPIGAGASGQVWRAERRWDGRRWR